MNRTPTPDPRTAYGIAVESAADDRRVVLPYRHTEHLNTETPTTARVRSITLGVLFVILALFALGFAGSGDYRAACDDILSAGASDASDAVQCAEDFPELNR